MNSEEEADKAARDFNFGAQASHKQNYTLEH
jgi:hypothetical protein